MSTIEISITMPQEVADRTPQQMKEKVLTMTRFIQKIIEEENIDMMITYSQALFILCEKILTHQAKNQENERGTLQ